MTETPSAKPQKATDLMWEAVRDVMVQLDAVPGWIEWRKTKMVYTLNFDDPFLGEDFGRPVREFIFPEHLERQHRLIMTYLELAGSIEALRDVEHYFRRYPFRGTKISYRTHLVYVCEMYFSRFYEFRERMKNVLDAANALIAPAKLQAGKYIKLFDQTFKTELRERHSVHHHDRFEDVELSRFFLSEARVLSGEASEALQEAMRVEYRAISRRWAKRVRRQADRAALFLEGVAQALVDNCNLPGATVDEAVAALTHDMEATSAAMLESAREREEE